MKISSLRQRLLCCFLVLSHLSILVLISCNQEEEPEPFVNDPNFDDFAIVESIQLTNEENPIFSNLEIKFNYRFNSEVSLANTDIRYRPRFTSITSPNLDLSEEVAFVWSADSTSVTIVPETTLPPSRVIQIRVNTLWERFIDNTWQERGNIAATATFEINEFPEIFDTFSIGEGEVVGVFDRFQFNTKVPLNDPIDQFRPVVEQVSLIFDDETLESAIEPVDDQNQVFEVRPASFLPVAPMDERFQILVKANWQKRIGEEWVNVNETDDEVAFNTNFVEVVPTLFPAANSTAVSVFENPGVSFDMPIGEPLETNETIRPNLKSISLKDGNGTLINGEIEKLENGDIRYLLANQLPEMQAFTFSVELQWEQLVDGEWMSVDEQFESEFSSSFTTTTVEESQVLDDFLIAYQYPIANQVNFLKQESPTGYVKLKSNDADLENLLAQTQPEGLLAIFRTHADEYRSEQSLIYNQGEAEFSFDIPADLPNDKVLTLELFADNVLISKLFFGTSIHDTFEDRLTSLSLRETAVRFPVRNWVDLLLVNFGGQSVDNLLDKAEYDLMVSVELDLEGEDYFENFIFPLIYDGIERNELSLSRDVGPSYRKKIVESVRIRQSDYLEVNAENFVNGTRLLETTDFTGGGEINNFATFTYDEDYFDVRDQINRMNADDRTDWMNQFLETRRSRVAKGTYKLRLRYTLPGESQPSSEVIVTYENPIG